MIAHFSAGELPIPASNPDGSPQKPRTRCACFLKEEAETLEGITAYEGCPTDAEKCTITKSKN